MMKSKPLDRCEATLKHAAQSQQFESWLLSMGYRDPQALLRASERYKITGDTFATPEHGLVFVILCECGVQGIPPTVELVRELCRRYGNSWPTGKSAPVPDVLESLLLAEGDAVGIGRIAWCVAELARRRGRARKLDRERVALLATLILPEDIDRAVGDGNGRCTTSLARRQRRQCVVRTTL